VSPLATALLAGYLLTAYGWPHLAAAGERRHRGLALLRRLAATALTVLIASPVVGADGLAVLTGCTALALLAQALAIPHVNSLPRWATAQAVHIGGLLAAWALLTWSPWPGATSGPLLPAAASWFDAVMVLGLILAVLRGGMTVTALVLRSFPSLPLDPVTARMGRTIGLLERALMLLLVSLGQWGAVGLVVAAKSVARFEALKERHFAEYYLIGTLTSLLIAALGGLALRFFL
jgi:hypothetical protein